MADMTFALSVEIRALSGIVGRACQLVLAFPPLPAPERGTRNDVV